MSPSKNIAVLGDLMIDEYLWGKVTRISPEAPVPIVEVNEEHLRPGGSANVAKNLIGLGQNVYLFGISGNDRMGNKLKTILETEGINTDGIIDSDNRPTTVKTRIIGGSQHLARVDKENTSPISSLEEKKILIQLQNSIKNL
ncbi:MAG: D-glycero-beta-D-manno-heptose-7-phosphate kinase, partial [Calditrichia bacterium]|nr:D-glycero-beta-D-manno-heptose-7-phosphate kinase [Calditrichia bacterium]